LAIKNPKLDPFLYWLGLGFDFSRLIIPNLSFFMLGWIRIRFLAMKNPKLDSFLYWIGLGFDFWRLKIQNLTLFYIG
jgi:hypothetical protein